MIVRIKFYAMLAKYLPADAVKNEADFTCDEGATITDVLTALGVPLEQCHLVLVNGIYVAPSERDSRALAENDALAIWPPVAGG